MMRLSGATKHAIAAELLPGERICGHCGIVWMPSAHLIKRRPASMLVWCQECRRRYNAAWRVKRRALGLKTNGVGNPDKIRLRMAEYVRRPERLAASRERIRKRRLAPDEQPKIAARVAVKAAILAGNLVRQLCHCGRKADAHHPDYSKPLEVVWLCRQHHADEHKRLRNVIS